MIHYDGTDFTKQNLLEMMKAFPPPPKNQTVLVGYQAYKAMYREFEVTELYADKFYGLPIHTKGWLKPDEIYIMAENIARAIFDIEELYGGGFARAILDKMLELSGQ